MNVAHMQPRHPAAAAAASILASAVVFVLTLAPALAAKVRQALRPFTSGVAR